VFWLVTVYDAEARSQAQAGQGKAALRSRFGRKGKWAPFEGPPSEG
jgi:hypothetical protein